MSSLKLPDKLPAAWLEAFKRGEAVRVDQDPTFGHDPADFPNCTSSSTLQNYVKGIPATPADAGTAQSITVKVRLYGTSKTKCALYRASDGVKVAETEEYTEAGASWQYVDYPNGKTYNFITPPSITVQQYWIVAFGGVAGCLIYYKSGASGAGRYGAATYPTFPDPWSPSEDYSEYAIYCTYTTVAPPAVGRVFMDGFVLLVV